MTEMTHTYSPCYWSEHKLTSEKPVKRIPVTDRYNCMQLINKTVNTFSFKQVMCKLFCRPISLNRSTSPTRRGLLFMTIVLGIKGAECLNRRPYFRRLTSKGQSF